MNAEYRHGAVIEIIRQQSCCSETPGPEMSLADDLGMDSLDNIELMLELEAEHGIDIPDHEVETWQTVRDVISTVARLAPGPQ